MASQTVGCACTVNIMSSMVASSCRAATDSARISVASGPMMCTPKTSPVCVVRHYFDESIVMIEYGSLAIAQEREFAGLHCITRVARLFFRKPDGSDLRLAVGGIRNAAPFQRRHLLAGYFSDGDDAFHRRGVRQLRHSRHDISDRIHLRLGSFHVSPHMHEAALDFGARFLQADVLGQGRSSHSNQDVLGREILRLAGFVAKYDGSSGRVFLYRFDLCFGENTNAPLAKSLLQFRGNFLVFQRHNARKHFENR